MSVYLSDSDIPIPKEKGTEVRKPPSETPNPHEQQPGIVVRPDPDADIKSVGPDQENTAAIAEEPRGREPHKPAQRPSLMDASFSFMLGENRHRSSFVSSVADLPEQRRESESRPPPKKTAAQSKAPPQRKGSCSRDDGFNLTNIHGGQG